MDWPCQALQIVLFGAQPTPKPDALIPWMKVFKSSPNGFNSAGPGKPSAAYGVSENLQFVMQAAPDRLDLVVTAPASDSDGGPPLITDFDEALRLATLRGIDLAVGYPTIRYAVIGTFMSIVDTREEANKALGVELPQIGFPIDCWDPSYQLNVRKELPGIGPVNRLRRWSGGILQMIQIQFGAASPTSFPATNPKFIAAAMIDVNTPPESSPTGDAGHILGALAD
jgi:hypothetical protein